MLEPTASDASMAASAVVEGIGIGRASVWANDPTPRAEAGTVADEHIRLAGAIRLATAGVEDLVRLLPPGEAELFEPELAILRELTPRMLGHVDAGMSAEDAVDASMAKRPTDLVDDARARLLDALGRGPRTLDTLLTGQEGDRVLVTEELTPSVVASLPGRVVAIVAAARPGAEGRGAGHASHAAILARGRAIPLVLVPEEVLRAIADDDLVIVDATVAGASVWLSPSDARLAIARLRREAWALRCRDEESRVTARPTLVGLAVHVNIGSLHEGFPASADGVGLVRTELLFARWSQSPSELEQFGILSLIAAKAGPAPVVVRLFDAGGDKPLPWLRAQDGRPEQRGIDLLLAYPSVLDTQLRAITRVADGADVRVLLPLVGHAGHVERVRALTRDGIPIGAMIETPLAVDRGEEIAAASDFVCIGTNDLVASLSSAPMAGSTPDVDLFRMVKRVVDAAHGHRRKVSVCGEMASDPRVARVLVGLGVDAISVAVGRFATVKLSLRDATIDDCRALAAEALKA
jgi:phosphoenolpyruvate-protein kinase (PTS system EI component)